MFWLGDICLMTTRNQNWFKILLRRAKFGWVAIPSLLILPVAYQLSAQNAADSGSDVAPAIQAMVKTLLTENADPSLRKVQAQALLQYPNADQAQQALIDILNSNNNTSAKVIICQAVAAQPNPLLTGNDQATLLPEFIDPLFKALTSDNTELSAVAAQALAKCRDGVPEKLSKMALDTQLSPAHRLAAISALSLLPGKEPVLALAELLNDQQPSPIRQRTAQALADMLLPGIPKNLDEFIKIFQQQYLPQIKNTDEESFLLWQYDRIKQELDQARIAKIAQEEQSLQWFKKYIEQLTAQFNAKTQPAERLEFLQKFLLNQSEPLLRAWALERIREWSSAESVQTGPTAQQIVDLVKPFITDPDPQVRRNTAATLALLTKQAKSTATALMEQLTKEKDPLAQAALIQALGAFEHTPAADSALKLLSSDNPAVVGQAARALGRITATQVHPPAAELVSKIAEALSRNFNRFNDAAEVRLDIILAMRKIATQEKYLSVAKETFNGIFTQALNDASERVRSEAVYALAEIHHEKVLALLLQPKNLLQDPDTAVRLAVIGIIQSYPDKNLLSPLRQQLLLEKNTDVANHICSAFGKILSTQPMQFIYTWAVKLKNTTSNGSPNKQESTLCDQVFVILTDRINQAKSANQKFPPEYEVFTLRHQVDIALREKKPSQAVNRLLALIALQQAEPSQTNLYQQQIIRIALQNPQDETLLPLARQALKVILTTPLALALLNEIDQTCQTALKKSDSTPHAASIVVHLILPLGDMLPAQTKSTWEQHRIQAALSLINSQEKLLAGEKDTKENPEIITLLGQLDPKFKDYPLSESREKRLAALIKFRQFLQPPPSDTIVPPKTTPPNEPNTTPPVAKKSSPSSAN
jgi:HEAT repeat protein